MKMVSGLSTPTSGELSLFGASGREAKKYHSRIGNLIEQPGLYDGMGAKENLHLKCLALGIHEKGYEEKLLETVGLKNVKGKKVKQFSLGMKQRLGIAMALVGRPDLLILDEPVNGLDPQGIAEIRELLLTLKAEKNMTILISSHILEELYKVADTFGIIHKGVLIQELSKENLDRKCSDYTEIRTGDTGKACPEEMGYRNYQVISSDSIHIYDTVTGIGELNMELAKGGGYFYWSGRDLHRGRESGSGGKFWDCSEGAGERKWGDSHFSGILQFRCGIGDCPDVFDDRLCDLF
ncbi:MAG: ATP-binding cassette domain-containing protein [Roseburia sp.]|nr:ATP-binding cassette domain-containing protein [Roseburia sp.]